MYPNRIRLKILPPTPPLRIIDPSLHSLPYSALLAHPHPLDIYRPYHAPLPLLRSSAHRTPPHLRPILRSSALLVRDRRRRDLDLGRSQAQRLRGGSWSMPLRRRKMGRQRRRQWGKRRTQNQIRPHRQIQIWVRKSTHPLYPPVPPISPIPH